MARINHRQVEAFRAVMLTGGMTAAAELLGITQPAVSRLVRDFEATVGVGLFERRGFGVVPTADASLLLAEVERSFTGLDRVAQAAQAIRAQETGWVRIAVLPALATSVLPRVVGRFARGRPNLRIAIEPMPSHLVVETVAAGRVDVGYAIGPSDRPGFVIAPLPARAVAVLPVGHRLAERTRIVPADFAGERFITVAQGTLFHSRVQTVLAEVSRVLHTETAWSETACLLVAEGMGVSVVDPFAAREWEGRGVVVRPLAPTVDVGIVSLRLPQRPVTPLGRSVMEHISAGIAAVDALSSPSGPQERAPRRHDEPRPR